MRFRRYLGVAVFFMLACLLSPARMALADTAVRMAGGLFAKGDILWFGQIDTTDSLGHYQGPIPWQVLDPAKAYDGTEGRTTLLSRYGLTQEEYGTMSDAWLTTRLRKALQAMAENRSIFSQVEYDLMLPMTTAGAVPLQADILYPLTENDMGSSGYITDSEQRKAVAITDQTEVVNYWLRWHEGSLVSVIDFTGNIVRLPDLPLVYYSRPATTIETGNIALYATVGGKQGGAGGLAANRTDLTGDYVLTLLDSSRAFTTYSGVPTSVSDKKVSDGAGQTVTTAGGTVSIPYSGATVGENEYISAIITGDDVGADVLYYGRVMHTTAAEDESGTVAVRVPAGLTAGKAYSLRLFSEQYNGGADGRSRLTDYISGYSTVSLTVVAAAAVPETGDAQTPLLWLCLAALSAAALAGLRIALRGRRAQGGEP